jgi:NADH:ubiquinone oxidoreductase subunit K
MRNIILNFSNNGLFRLAITLGIINLMWNAVNLFILVNLDYALLTSVTINIIESSDFVWDGIDGIFIGIMILIIYALESVLVPFLLVRAFDWILAGFKKDK